ncbi:enolase C-terminal domain-like protein [Nocardia fusca]|uniref:enolase C-terminal domain-like protein n=1 Tax=Nocardia fusca TaxID=941183 RepID=UPI0037CC4D90
MRAHIGDDVPLMVDANQQWDRPTAQRMGRAMEEYHLDWIEEPLDAYEAKGHAALAASLDTPIATGEMLASVAEHKELIRLGAADIIQPDAPRIGGITRFLELAALAENENLQLAPHFAMEIHLHLAAAYPIEPWVDTSTGWSRCSTNAWRSATAACMSPPGRDSASLSVSRHGPVR